MDAACADATNRAIDNLAFPNEPQIARTLIAAARPGQLIHLGSSMPIRDVDTFATPRSDITVLANRGVNGIDGTISTAIGAALAGRPTTLLVGDIAALHDATALSEAVRLDAPLRIIVVNNDGGGIFSFLPQATSDLVEASAYERHWGTPHGLSLCDVALGFGMTASLVEDHDTYIAVLSQPIAAPELIELQTDRIGNVSHHRSIRSAVTRGYSSL